MPIIARKYERTGTAPRPHHHPRGALRSPCPLPSSSLQTHRYVLRVVLRWGSSTAQTVRCLRRRRWLRLWLSPPPPLVGVPAKICARGHDRRKADSCACGCTDGITTSLHSCFAFVCRPTGRKPLRGRFGPLVKIQTCGALSPTRLWALTRPQSRFCSTKKELKVKIS